MPPRLRGGRVTFNLDHLYQRRRGVSARRTNGRGDLAECPGRDQSQTGNEPGQRVWPRDIHRPGVTRKLVIGGFDDGNIIAFDFKTGKKKWTFFTGKPIQSSPSVASESDLVYFGCNDGKVYCLDAKTGVKQWAHTTGGAVISSPWPADGVIYVGSDDGFVCAVTGE